MHYNLVSACNNIIGNVDRQAKVQQRLYRLHHEESKLHVPVLLIQRLHQELQSGSIILKI